MMCTISNRFCWFVMLFLAAVAMCPIAPIFAIEPYVWADYLIWKAKEDGLLFADVLPAGFPPVAQPIVTRMVEQDFSWRSGVRLGAGCMWCNDWDASLAWTRMTANTCSKVADSTVPNTIIASALAGLGGAGTFFATSAQSTWHLQLDAIDGDLGRWLSAAECISWSPYVSGLVA